MRLSSPVLIPLGVQERIRTERARPLLREGRALGVFSVRRWAAIRCINLTGAILTTSRLFAAAMFITVAIAGLVACGSGTNATNDNSPAGVRPPSAASSSAPTSSSAQPMSFYAAQYIKIGATCIADQDALNKLIDQTPQDPEAIEKQGMKIAADCQAADAEMLRASWPPAILPEVKAEVTADGPVLGDLMDLEGNQDNLQRDSGAANAAANILRADLGLPPIQ